MFWPCLQRVTNRPTDRWLSLFRPRFVHVHSLGPSCGGGVNACMYVCTVCFNGLSIDSPTDIQGEQPRRRRCCSYSICSSSKSSTLLAPCRHNKLDCALRTSLNPAAASGGIDDLLPKGLFRNAKLICRDGVLSISKFGSMINFGIEFVATSMNAFGVRFICKFSSLSRVFHDMCE